tara:strand:- start:559 stop:1122 length:564 start_codon:yes stop_codon:yes gene_type:complete
MDESNQSKRLLPDSLKRNTKRLTIVGMIFIILGIIGFSMTVSLTVASVLLFGVLLLIAAASQLVDVISCQSVKGAMWHVLIAMLYILSGAIMLFDPILASTLLTAFIASFLIMIGFFRMAMAWSIRQSAGFFLISLTGLASIILGTLILSQWPGSGLWLIGLFIAIELFINGLSCLLLAYAIKNSRL